MCLRAVAHVVLHCSLSLRLERCLNPSVPTGGRLRRRRGRGQPEPGSVVATHRARRLTRPFVPRRAARDAEERITSQGVLVSRGHEANRIRDPAGVRGAERNVGCLGRFEHHEHRHDRGSVTRACHGGRGDLPARRVSESNCLRCSRYSSSRRDGHGDPLRERG